MTTTPPLDAGQDSPCGNRSAKSAGSDAMRSVLQYSLLVPVLLLAAWFRTRWIGDLGLWIDEAFTLRMSEFSWGEMFQRLARDTHPPLFNTLLKLWTGVAGETTAMARLLPVSCGVAAVGAMFLFVRRAYWRDDAEFRENFRIAVLPGLVAATLLALAPMHTFWSLIIRMYSLGTLLALVSSWLLMRALRAETPRLRDWCWYALSAALLGYTHYFGLFTLFAQFVFAIGYRLFLGQAKLIDRISPVLVSFFCVWIAWQPWVPSFLEQRANVSHTFYLHGSVGEMMGRALHRVWVGQGQPVAPATGWLIAQGCFVCLLVLLLARRAADWFVVAAALTPLLAALIVSHLSRPLITAHYLQFSHVFLLAAVAIVASRVPHLGRLLCIGAVVGLMSYLAHNHYDWREQVSLRPGTRAAISRFDDSSRHGSEPLLTANPFLYSLAHVQTEHPRDVYLYGSPDYFPFFTGTAVVPDEAYVAADWLSGSEWRYVWSLDEQRSSRVPMPPDWRLLAQETYPDWYGTFVLRLYVRNTGQPPADDEASHAHD